MVFQLTCRCRNCYASCFEVRFGISTDVIENVSSLSSPYPVPAVSLNISQPLCFPHFNLLTLSLLGILRYRVDFQGMEYQGDDDEFFDLDDY